MKFTYDDRNLQQLFAEMDVQQRLKAMKGAFRKEANRVRKIAVNNLRGSGFKTDATLEKGVRAVVFKRTAGFKVTIAPKRQAKKVQSADAKYWAHRHKQQKEMGLLLVWAEEGTEMRRTKTKTRVWKRSRKGHSTGRIKRYGFMRKTRTQVKDTVTNSLHEEVRRTITKIAKKNGCK